MRHVKVVHTAVGGGGLDVRERSEFPSIRRISAYVLNAACGYVEQQEHNPVVLDVVQSLPRVGPPTPSDPTRLTPTPSTWSNRSIR